MVQGAADFKRFYRPLTSPSVVRERAQGGAVVEEERGAADFDEALMLELAEEARDGLARGAD
jgi:hypothetical protein